MSTPSSRRTLLVTAAAVAISVSCGSPPAAPSPVPSPPSAEVPQSPAPDVPVNRSLAEVIRLEIVAPREIAPQESVQLRAHAVRADGSVENVTSQATWSVRSVSMLAVPSQPVLAVTPQGLATGGDRGRALVAVRFADQTLEATIYVVPTGTFSLVGKVTDEGAAVAGATVIVAAGIGDNLWARTDSAGLYEIYGVAGRIQVRASKDGYADTIHESDVREHGSLALELRPREPWDDYAGTYTFTIAGEHCIEMLPQVRVYTARIDQVGRQLQVSLSGAQFWKNGDGFAGTVRPNGEVDFWIRPVSPWNYDGFDLAERLPGGGDLIVGGDITARRTGTGLVGNPPSDWNDGLYMRPNSPTGICMVGRFEMQR